MPETLAFFLFTLGAPVGVVNAVATGIGATLIKGVASVGLSVGASFLQMQRAPAPKPEDVQQTSRQPAQSRVKHYGRVKVSGPWLFAEAKEAIFHKVIAMGQGPIDAIEEFWIDDEFVVLNALSNFIITAPWDSHVQIFTRLGEIPSPYISTLTANFPEWTANHRADGIALLYCIQYAVNQNEYQDVYPNGINTHFRCVIRGAKCRPIGGGTPVWFDNAPNVIYDYIIHPDGLRMPTAVTDTPEAIAGWTAAFNRATELVSLAAGGSEFRYRIWGSYYFNERPADVLSRMLEACDGRLIRTSDGGITLDIGAHPGTPAVTIDQTAIVGLSELTKGQDILSAANKITATYLEPGSDYQTQDATPWEDAADIAARGEIVADLPLSMVPSNSQARRLMKLAFYRANPRWKGAFECNLKGLAVMGERFITIRYPQFEIDEVFEIEDIRLNMEGDMLKSVTIVAQSMPAEAYNWSTDQEGDTPNFTRLDPVSVIPIPTGLVLNHNTSTNQLEISANSPPSIALYLQYRFRADGGDWVTVDAPEGGTTIVTGVVSGVLYEAQARHITLATKAGDWSDTVSLTIITDGSAPADVLAVAALGGVGEVALSWTAPDSSNFAQVKITRHTSDDEVSATEISASPVAGLPNDPGSVTDTGLSAGTYYYWIYAQNGAGVDDGTGVATGSVTAT